MGSNFAISPICMAALWKLYLWMLPQCFFALELHNDIVDVKGHLHLCLATLPAANYPTPECLGAILLCITLSTTHHQELMKLVSSHGRLSPLFMKKVMIRYFLSNIHQVMTEFIVVLHSNSSEDFSTISLVCFVSAKNHYSTRLSPP